MVNVSASIPPFSAVPRHAHVPPLGVHVRDGGVDVAVLAAHATGVEFCLIDVLDPALAPDEAARYSERRIALGGPTYGVWHAFVPGVQEGQRYGFRTHGPWDPAAGMHHNPAKLLVDPYARGVVGEVDYSAACYGHEAVVDEPGRSVGDPYGPADTRDSLAHVPHSVVVGPLGDLAVRRPHVPWADMVVYEAHVRGLTMLAPDVPEHLRGTYAGLAHPATIAYLTSLGITTIELLPIHASVTEPHLITKGLTNYWGYSTLGYFAPNPAYATQAARDAGPRAVLDEVRGMVHLLHEAGIEVILDVVHNHTAEGGNDGLHLSWRGLDNSGYYRHDGSVPARLADFTGCGNSLDFRRPRVVQMVLDSLRYWADVVGVDGFRYDLAVTYARGSDGFDPNHPFLVGLQTDPSLIGLKHIAEPWDLGPGGWRTGQFPPPMAEWNDHFRDAVRQFWLADAAEASHGRPGCGVRDLATRLAGSADVFGYGDPPLMRGPVASINYVTAHDGFTLADLVSFDHKHNEANGESNRDGTDYNRSWNHGFEGRLHALTSGDALLLTPGAEIVPLRRRSIRNILATLLFAGGTPMITAGDERGRTQEGDNNAYAQDNALSWMSWDELPWQTDLRATTAFLIELRRKHPALRPDDFYTGRPRTVGADDEIAVPDLAWFGGDGKVLDHDAWHDPATRILQMARTAPTPGARDVLWILNGSLDAVEVTLGGTGPTTLAWELAWDSAWQSPADAATVDETTAAVGKTVEMEALSTRVYIAAAK